MPRLEGSDESRGRLDSIDPSAGLQTAGIAVGVFGAMIMIGAVVLAWPEPAMLLPTALIVAAAMISVAIWFAIPSAYVPAGIALAAAWLVGFYLVRGDVAWTLNDAQAMRQTLVSATSGHALVPLAGIFAGVAGWLSRTRRTEDSFFVGLVAAATAAASLGTGVVVRFCAARAIRPTRPGRWPCTRLPRLPRPFGSIAKTLAYAGSALLLATLVQAIVYRYALSWARASRGSCGSRPCWRIRRSRRSAAAPLRRRRFRKSKKARGGPDPLGADHVACRGRVDRIRGRSGVGQRALR